MKENNEVISFIEKIYCRGGDNDDMCKEVLRRQFRAGYCYYFAHMLKIAFNRGEVCWCAPFGHMCWVDVDGTPYDCEGEYTGEAVYLIPEHYLGDAIKDFKHIDETYDTSYDVMLDIINRYRIDEDISNDIDMIEYMEKHLFPRNEPY